MGRRVFEKLPNRFNEVVVRVNHPDEQMVMTAFTRGLKVSHFAESLVRHMSTSIVDIRGRRTCYIRANEAMTKKKEEERCEGVIQKIHQSREGNKKFPILSEDA